VHELLGGLGNGSAFVTSTILWALLAATGAIVIATSIAVGRTRAKARRATKGPARPVHEECARYGHKYKTYGTGTAALRVVTTFPALKASSTAGPKTVDMSDADTHGETHFATPGQSSLS
jgi:hypothetical protein